MARGRGYRLLSPDLPGHGELGQVPLGGGDVDFVRRLCDPWTVLRGSSWGAFLALHAASADENVRAVIAIAPTSERLIAERWPEWNARVDAAALERFLAEHDVYEAAARIEAPVLYVIARDDERIALANVERLAAVTPRSELVVLDAGGHAGPSHDRAVHRLTLDWLERRLSVTK